MAPSCMSGTKPCRRSAPNQSDRLLDVSSGCSSNASAQVAVQGLVLRAARRANLRNVGVHVLRHTFCSHLAMRGAPTRAIQELAGHRDLVTTQHYMHLSPSAVEDAIRLLEQGAPRGNMVAT